MSEEKTARGLTRDQKAHAEALMLMYLLFLASTVLHVTGLFGAIWALSNRENAPDWLASHYEYLINTFIKGSILWIGSLFLITIHIGWLLLPLAYVWWIIRAAKGFQKLMNKEEIEDTKGWLF